MADEQHEWLDADVAEKLLRGEPVGPVDDHAGTEARRLEAALLALRTVSPPDGELPGEKAVLAAFREARGAGRAGAASPAGHTGQQDVLRTVRIGASPAAPLRRPRWTRPVRYGLAVSLVGCALGGVAVAGGTGVLPAPFGGHGSPVPASSVSAAASPEELGAEEPDAGEPSPLPSVTPGVPRPPRASEVPVPPGGGTDGSDGPAGQTDGGADREGEDREGGGTEGGTDGREAPGRNPAEVYRKSVKACRGHRADSLSRDEERRLLELARGEANLDRFCDRLLGADDRDGGSGQDGPDDGKGDGDGRNDDGKGDGATDGEGSLTSLTRSAEATRDGVTRDVSRRRPAAALTESSQALSSITR
ncbi:hypothetical protein [Streptomyces sp. NBC_01185]|uniref:hypothetical protein n=1 Tax=Streptomyces sp. NBC_01185 TaxID=2903764 RepID=UPI0038681450|nr:hypothetical protein OG770_14140 [Streptomyces sp. NBC_01185]